MLSAEAANTERLGVSLIEVERLSRDSVVLAESPYRGGRTPLLDVFVADHASANASFALASAQVETARAFASLCIAFGLGAPPCDSAELRLPKRR